MRLKRNLLAQHIKTQGRERKCLPLSPLELAANQLLSLWVCFLPLAWSICQFACQQELPSSISTREGSHWSHLGHVFTHGYGGTMF